MKIPRRLAAGLCIAGVTLAAAPTVPLDVRRGLWEISVAGSPGALKLPVPQGMLDALPPEQRARAELGLLAAGVAQSLKVCLTDAAIADALHALRSDHASNCDRRVVTNTARAFEIRGQCEQAHVSRGYLHVDALDRTTMQGTFEITLSLGGEPTTIHRALSARWLSDDCGDVPPPG
jgi:hypothetical protein